MNPGLTRLRTHPAAEGVRQAVLRDQQAALKAAAGARSPPKPQGPRRDGQQVALKAPAGGRSPHKPKAVQVRPRDGRHITVVVAKNPKRARRRNASRCTGRG
jgi:hypothetical protein